MGGFIMEIALHDYDRILKCNVEHSETTFFIQPIINNGCQQLKQVIHVTRNAANHNPLSN